MSTHIEDLVAEGSDFQLEALLVGPDGITPVGNDVVTEILMTIRDTASATFIAEDRNVTSALDINGNFSTQLSAADNVAVPTSGKNQLRLITLKVTHSGGKKRNQEITYYLENMQDVE
jgi:hypothetical protein